MVEESIPKLLVGVDQDLGVSVRAEHMPAVLQASPNLLEVVDLAIEDRPDGLPFIRHRLLAGGQIDDREAAHAQPDLVRGVVAIIIRAAMPQAGRHSPQGGIIPARSGTGRGETPDAAPLTS